MKKVFTLLIICFFFFKSYALNADYKDAPGAIYANVRVTYRDLLTPPADDFIAYVCEGLSRTFTVTSSGATSYTWYKDGVVIPGATSDKLTVNSAGKYNAKANNGSLSNTVTVVMSQKPGKPSITFTE
jgi:hypothetical protein